MSRRRSPARTTSRYLSTTNMSLSSFSPSGKPYFMILKMTFYFLRIRNFLNVHFYQNRCVFSKKIHDIWEHVGEKFEHQSDVLIAEIDCGAYKSICQKFNVREYPTLLMFRDGKRFERYIGPRTSNDIISYIKKFLVMRKLRDV